MATTPDVEANHETVAFANMHNSGEEPHNILPGLLSVTFLKKVIAEGVGTFFLVFAGCAANMIDKKTDGSITHFGCAVSWGIAAMIVIYAVGHISGAHLNPAVTLAFAAVREFPLIHVPAYIGIQTLASLAAAFVLKAMFGNIAQLGATLPGDSLAVVFVFEVFATFLLMFVISAVATDTKAIGELAGFAIGSTIALDVVITGPITGASMNPARTLGPAIAAGTYKSIWIYMLAPTIGALLGAGAYCLVRLNEKPVRELTKSGSFIRQNSIFRRSRSSRSGHR